MYLVRYEDNPTEGDLYCEMNEGLIIYQLSWKTDNMFKNTLIIPKQIKLVN